MDRVRVLIVEDNHHMSTILRTLLQGLGIRDVVEAASGEEALELLESTAPDLALVDYHLGEMNGLELTRRVRTSPDSPCKYLPIILVTAYAERWRVRAAVDAGVNEFVVKPVSMTSLMGRLRAVIEKPRAYVASPAYSGPDRRRRVDPAYRGPWRRDDDSDRGSGGNAVDV